MKTNTNMKLIDIDELCQILNVKKSYVYSLTHTKQIPYYKIGGHIRFKLSEIETWLEHQKINVYEPVNLVDF